MFDFLKVFGLSVALSVALSVGTVGAALAQDGDDGCLGVSDLRDKDIRRNMAQLGPDSGICLSELEFSENGLNWRLTIAENSKHPKGSTIFLLHDNENSAFDASLYGIKKYGGKLVAVEAGDKRQFKGQDPNRNFGVAKSTTSTCRDMRTKPAPLFTQFLLDLHNGNLNYILTMHNNANGHSGNGGSGGISAARNSTVMHGLQAPNGGDEDDAVLLAGTKPYDKNNRAKKAVSYFHKQGINVIYEHVTPERNDCSFSNHVVLTGIASYFNIEAEHGHTAQQKQMLDVLMKFHRMRVRDKSVN